MEYACDSLKKAQDMEAYCLEKKYTNIQIIPLASLQVIQINGTPPYQFATQALITNADDGLTHLVTADVP